MAAARAVEAVAREALRDEQVLARASGSFAGNAASTASDGQRASGDDSIVTRTIWYGHCSPRTDDASGPSRPGRTARR